MSRAATTSSSAFPLSGLVTWVGGIAAPVIAAVLIYYLTRPTPPPPPSPTTELNGFVADAVSHVLIPNALVVVSLGPNLNSVSQQTDPLGRYNVVLETTGSAAVMGQVNITAEGYQSYRNTVALQPGDNFGEITLQPETPAPPTASAAGHPQTAAPMAPRATTRAAITIKAPPKDYVKKQSFVVLRMKS